MVQQLFTKIAVPALVMAVIMVAEPARGQPRLPVRPAYHGRVSMGFPGAVQSGFAGFVPMPGAPVGFQARAAYAYYSRYGGYLSTYPYGYNAGFYSPDWAAHSTNPYGQNANSYETSSFNGYQSGAGGAYAAYPKDYTTGENPYLSTYLSTYPTTAETAMPADTRAYLTVTVPANAQVWVGDRLSSQKGTVRQFYSSPLTPGKNFTYEIRARWLQEGAAVERVLRVPVGAGAKVTADFMTPG